MQDQLRQQLVLLGWPISSAPEEWVIRALEDWQGLTTWKGKNGKFLSVDGIFGEQTLHSFEQAFDLGGDSKRGFKISPNFRTGEFKCQCTPTWIDGDRDVVMLLEAIRSEVGGPLIPASAHRTDEHNKLVGGAVGSFHTCHPRGWVPSGNQRGCNTSAVDLEWDYGASYKLVRDQLGWEGGIGRVDINDVVVHIDKGPNRDWRYNHLTGQAY